MLMAFCGLLHASCSSARRSLKSLPSADKCASSGMTATAVAEGSYQEQYANCYLCDLTMKVTAHRNVLAHLVQDGVLGQQPELHQ